MSKPIRKIRRTKKLSELLKKKAEHHFIKPWATGPLADLYAVVFFDEIATTHTLANAMRAAIFHKYSGDDQMGERQEQLESLAMRNFLSMDSEIVDSVFAQVFLDDPKIFEGLALLERGDDGEVTRTDLESEDLAEALKSTPGAVLAFGVQYLGAVQADVTKIRRAGKALAQDYHNAKKP